MLDAGVTDGVGAFLGDEVVGGLGSYDETEGCLDAAGGVGDG